MDASVRNDITEEEEKKLALKIVKLLNGLTVRQSMEVLDQARLCINDFHLVDISNEYFTAILKEFHVRYPE